MSRDPTFCEHGVDIGLVSTDCDLCNAAKRIAELEAAYARAIVDREAFAEVVLQRNALLIERAEARFRIRNALDHLRNKYIGPARAELLSVLGEDEQRTTGALRAKKTEST